MRVSFSHIQLVALFVVLLGTSSPIMADDIRITNTGGAAISVSDLTLYTGMNQTGNSQVVLRSGFDGDDFTVMNGAERNLNNVPANGNPLIAWRSYDISYSMDSKTFRGNRNGAQPSIVVDLKIALFDNEPNRNDPLHIGLTEDFFTSTQVIAENTTYSIVNGFDPLLPGYFFSTTRFEINPDGTPGAGASPLTGTVISSGSFQITPQTVPEPTSLLLMATGCLAVVGGSRVRRRKSAA